MFNMLNARKVEDELNVFEGIFQSHIFWVIWVLICGFQARPAVLALLACVEAAGAQGRLPAGLLVAPPLPPHHPSF